MKRTTRVLGQGPIWRLVFGLILSLAMGVSRSSGATVTWTNNTLSGNFNYTNNLNWNTGAAPGPDDTARFTNSVGFTVSFTSDPLNANVLFDGTGGGVMSLSGPGRTWTVTNSVVLGGAASSSATISVGGNLTLAITNAAGTGVLDIGPNAAGVGFVSLNNCTLITDHFYATNGANSKLELRVGTLTTLHGSTYITNRVAGAGLGLNQTSAGGKVTWNMQGGTNAFLFGTVGAATSFGSVNNSTGIVNVAGASTLWTNTLPFEIGRANKTATHGELNISDGATVVTSGNSFLGGASSHSNLVTVVGGSLWRMDGQLTMGNGSSSNVMTIATGGTVQLVGASAVLTVGAGATTTNNVVTLNGGNLNVGGTVNIGNRGYANQLFVTNGSQAALAGQVLVGLSATNGSVFVGGGDSLMTVGSTLTVGAPAINGAPLGASNSVTVGSGGKILINNGLLIGSSNTVDNSANFVTISGGSLFVTNASGTGVARVGNGALNLTSGALTVDKLIVTNAIAGNSVVNFAGGTFNTKQTWITNGAAFVVGDGTSAATLNLQGGTHSFADGLAIANNATLKGNGAITANVAVNSGGLVSPGSSIAALNVTGNVNFGSNGAFTVELGLTPGDNDLLALTGTLTLDANSVLNISGGAIGNVYTVATYSAVSGGFGSWTAGYDLTYNANSLTLEVVPEPSTLVLCLSGIGLCMLLRRRRPTKRWVP